MELRSLAMPSLLPDRTAALPRPPIKVRDVPTPKPPTVAPVAKMHQDPGKPAVWLILVVTKKGDETLEKGPKRLFKFFFGMKSYPVYVGITIKHPL